MSGSASSGRAPALYFPRGTVNYADTPTPPANPSAVLAAAAFSPPAPPPQPASWLASSRAPPPLPHRPLSASQTHTVDTYKQNGPLAQRALPPRTSSHRDLHASTVGLAPAFSPQGPPLRAPSLQSFSSHRSSPGPSASTPSAPTAYTHVGLAREPVTPRAATASFSAERQNDLTPRGVGSLSGKTPRPRVASAPAHVSPPALRPFDAHTPPMLLPRQFSASYGLYDAPTRSSSRTALNVDTASMANDHDGGSSDDLPHPASLSSSSEDDDNAWAGTLLPTGSSPVRSSLLADMAAASGDTQLRGPPVRPQPSEAEAPGPSTNTTERPMSEFDWAAAYAHSRSPSLLHAPALTPGLEPVASPPLPPLPREATEEADREPSSRANLITSSRGPGDQRQPAPSNARGSTLSASFIASPKTNGPPRLQTVIPSSSFSSPSTSPTSSHPPSLPSAGPSESATLGVPPLHSSESSAGSSAGRRSPGPQPPRPARRQTSALSLRSATSAGAGDPAAPFPPKGELHDVAKAEAVTEDEVRQNERPAPSPGSKSTENTLEAARTPAGKANPPVSFDSQAPPPPPHTPTPASVAAYTPRTNATATTTRSDPPAPAPALTASLAAPTATTPPVALALATPRLRNPSSGSRRGGPAPSVPEKSARRMSRRLSVLGGLIPGTPPPEGAAPPGGASGRGSPAVEQGERAGESANRSSVPYSVSDLALAYGRDSWADWSVSSESEPPGSVRSPATTPAGTSLNGHVDPSGAQSREPDGIGEETQAPRVSLDPRLDLHVDTAIEKQTPPPQEREEVAVSPATPTRGDAKARAAAFLADLKRAKAVQTNGPSPGTPSADPVDVVAMRPDSPTATESSAFVSPALPELPSLPLSPQPLPDDRPVFADAADAPVPSLEGSPPLPPSHDSKRPSIAGSVATLEITRGASTRFVPGYDLTTVSTQNGPPLLRHRALPQAVQLAVDLRRARTSRERGRIYAEKINQLGRERSRLDEWIAATTTGRSALARVSDTTPRRADRASRQEGSATTFAARGDGYGYRARELPSTLFSSRDLASASAPYPGVLQSAQGYRGGNPPLSSSSSKGSFFSGLGAVGRGSLGRRASKREHNHHHPHAGPYGHGLTISAPVQLLSSTNPSLTSPASTSGPNARPPLGPRMPMATSAASAAGMGRTGSQDRPSLDGYYSQNSASASPLPVRTSFSYGSTSSLLPGAGGFAGALAASASVPAQLGGGYGEYGAGEDASTPGEHEQAEADKLARLQDILPQAAKADLVDALTRAGGDDVLAISIYLSETVQ